MLRQSAAALLLLLPRRPVAAFSSAVVVTSHRHRPAFVSAAGSRTSIVNKRIIADGEEGRAKLSLSARATQQLSRRMSGQQEQQQSKRQKRSDIHVSGVHSCARLPVVGVTFVFRGCGGTSSEAETCGRASSRTPNLYGRPCVGRRWTKVLGAMHLPKRGPPLQFFKGSLWGRCTDKLVSVL